MKFGIISDLHMDFSRWNFKPEKDVFYIVAGDILEDKHERAFWLNRFEDKVFWIKGNHDYYNDFFDSAKSHMKSANINGLNIAGATLWTNFSPDKWGLFVYIMRDGKCIRDLSYEKYIDTHLTHKKFLMESNADIWVIHHCPSFLSVHPKYKGDVTNYFFATEMYEEIINLTNPPKLIIHGHTHEEFDYMIGDKTRVICHPRGYPNERDDFMRYKPLIVEI